MNHPLQYGQHGRPHGYQQPARQQHGYQQPVAPFGAPQQYGQPQYGQPRYGPPQQPRYQPPPPPPRKKPNKVVYFVSLALCLGIAGVAVVSSASASEPNVGDCLASMENRFIGGLEIVDCGASEAKYEVVNKQTGNGNPSVCLDHPGGESFREGGRKGKIYWEICAMPK